MISSANPEILDGGHQPEDIHKPHDNNDNHDSIQDGLNRSRHRDERVYEPKKNTYDNQRYGNLKQRHDAVTSVRVGLSRVGDGRVVPD